MADKDISPSERDAITCNRVIFLLCLEKIFNGLCVPHIIRLIFNFLLSFEDIIIFNLRRKAGGVNFTGLNLRCNDFRGMSLKWTNLWGAKLGGANLEGANLQGANLTRANLIDAILPEGFEM